MSNNDKVIDDVGQIYNPTEVNKDKNRHINKRT